MHVSDFNFATMEIRHLVAAYATVFILQGGYFLWMALNWRKLNSKKSF